MLVAVKQLQLKAAELDRVRFLQEAAIMGQFFHPNVVTLHGVVTKDDPVNQEFGYVPVWVPGPPSSGSVYVPVWVPGPPSSGSV